MASTTTHKMRRESTSSRCRNNVAGGRSHDSAELRAVVRLRFRRNDERVVYHVLLETDDFWKANARQKLHVKNLFHGSLKIEKADHFCAAQIHGGYAALELVSSFGQRDAVHR